MMRGKLVLLVGVGIGYVLGARAGRERYEDIKRVACRFWNDPRVTQQRDNVGQFARDKAPEVVDFIGDTAKKVITRTPAKDTEEPETAPSSAAPKKPAATKPSTTKSATASTSSTWSKK